MHIDLNRMRCVWRAHVTPGFCGALSHFSFRRSINRSDCRLVSKRVGRAGRWREHYVESFRATTIPGPHSTSSSDGCDLSLNTVGHSSPWAGFACWSRGGKKLCALRVNTHTHRICKALQRACSAVHELRKSIPVARQSLETTQADRFNCGGWMARVQKAL